MTYACTLYSFSGERINRFRSLRYKLTFLLTLFVLMFMLICYLQLFNNSDAMQNLLNFLFLAFEKI